MGRVVLDSSVVIAALNPKDKHHEVAIRNLAAGENEYLISSITLAETLTHAYQMGEGDAVAGILEASVDEVIEVSVEIAKLSAAIRGATRLKLPDALISATARKCAAELWTFDDSLAKLHEGPTKILGYIP